MLRPTVLVVLAAALGLAPPAAAGVLRVGPGARYATPCAAIAAAHAGDRIEIDARGNGRYDGDVCAWTTDRLHLVGVHGRARIDAAGRTAQGKAIWVIGGARTVIERVVLTGAHLEGDRNGAGIRQEGPGLTVRDSAFVGNDDGILTGENLRSDILIERSTFARNGFGDGYSHNIYVGHVRRFTLRDSISRDARVGHLVKSRAQTNVIVRNRLIGGRGTGSYELDLPDGGRATVVGNVLQQGPATENPTLLSYGAESLRNGTPRLLIAGNTFVDDRGRGTAIHVAAGGASSAVVRDNVSTGSATFVDAQVDRMARNCVTAAPRFMDRVGFDYRLRRRSPCRRGGRRQPGAPSRVAAP